MPRLRLRAMMGGMVDDLRLINKRVRTMARGAGDYWTEGLDHGVGHPMPFESTPWLAEAG
jgi:hypothetical protein